MACKLLCLVTDVGDSRIMVGETGKVVDSGDYKSLAKALFSYIEKTGLTRNVQARDRMIDKYEIKGISKAFGDNYLKIGLN